MSDEKYGLRKEIIETLINIGINSDVYRIILFGSRARGDYKRTSDIDIAVYGGDIASFAVEIEESVPTLLEFDVIDMTKPVQKELTDSIEKEGVLIYEKI